MSITPSFLLKKPATHTGLSLIYLQVKWGGQRLQYSTRENVNPKNWDKRRQRVRVTATTKDGEYLLNDLLDKMEEIVSNGFRKETVNGGTPTVVQIRKYLDDFFNHNKEHEGIEAEKPTFYQLVKMFIDNEILYKGKPKAASTIKSYKTTLKHLKTFEKEQQYEITYDTITLQFFYKFMKYLSDKGIQQNAQNKYVGCLKAFLSEAWELEYTQNLHFKKKKFGIGQKLSETVYLKEHEILQLHNTHFASTALENAKAALVLSCCTGLRYSDILTLKMEHIQVFDNEKFIKKVTQKTGTEVVIPLNDMVLDILHKYKDSGKGLPKVPCNQVLNKQLKKVCKAAGLTETGRLTESPEKELWECVSMHTGRRSFATNAHINGVPTLDIMRVTNHITEKSFMRYIRLSKLDAAKRFSQHMKMKQEKPLMVAV